MVEAIANSRDFKLGIKSAFGFLLYYLFVGVIIFGILKIAIPKCSIVILDSTITIATDLVGQFLVLWLIISRIRAKYYSGFGFSPKFSFDYRLLLSVVVVTIGYFFLYHNSIGILADKIPIGDLFTDYFKTIESDLKKNPFPFMISAIISAPFFEEVFFRGILLRGFLNKYKPIVAIILSALFFGLFHMNGPQFVNAFLIGLFLGFVYYSTRSLILCIAIHATNNSIAFLYDSDKHDPGFPAFLIGALLFFAGLWYLRKMGMLNFRKHPQPIDSQEAATRQIESKESISEEGSPGRLGY